MIKNVAVILSVIGLVVIFLPVISGFQEREDLNELGADYVQGSINELETPNVVTSVIVTYRGLDTLGEVTVLFLATVGVGLLLKGNKEDMIKISSLELLETTSSVLVALIMILGIYIFTHGHLSPGGGFQGGVIVASGFLLLMLSNVNARISQSIMHFVESFSGVAYVAVGVAGLVLTVGFLNPGVLPFGKFGDLFSSGAIPVIYSLIGLKVGSELTSILVTMRGE
ncbi:MAG: sodium:proton antiporter [Candidatus Sabulitectum sp.]|nr:sodium:proton antiporter [Candidatus Sabulitectum sp.]